MVGNPLARSPITFHFSLLTDARLLPAVFQTMRAGFFGAMDAAINLATGFDAVTDYLAITMGTGWCQHVNRAFEAVKGPSFSGRDNLE
jgi:hypothetical protein